MIQHTKSPTETDALIEGLRGQCLAKARLVIELMSDPRYYHDWPANRETIDKLKQTHRSLCDAVISTPEPKKG